jgi:hypothetical protein
MNDEAIRALTCVEVDQVIWALKWVRMLSACVIRPVRHRLTTVLHMRPNVGGERHATAWRREAPSSSDSPMPFPCRSATDPPAGCDAKH